MSKNYFGLMLLTLFLTACGGESKNSDEFSRQEEEAPEPEVLQRLYRAELSPVNAKVVKNVEGFVIIRLVQDRFEVGIGVKKVPSSIHHQHLRVASECPTLADDTNQDGYIDVQEAQKVSGKIYIPLDGDLDNISEDTRDYPNGGFLKAYIYRQETSRSRLLADLGPGADFDLANRVIMVFGVDEDEELPATVKTLGERPVQETLPISCGELFSVIGSDL